jgi:hypothetical protein
VTCDGRPAAALGLALIVFPLLLTGWQILTQEAWLTAKGFVAALRGRHGKSQ